MSHDTVEVPRALFEAWRGMCSGVDWNRGTHAKFHRATVERLMRELAASPGLSYEQPADAARGGAAAPQRAEPSQVAQAVPVAIKRPCRCVNSCQEDEIGLGGAEIYCDGLHNRDGSRIKATPPTADPAVQRDALQARLDDALFVLGMVDKNNRIDAGERGKAWSGRFVIDEVRCVVEGRAKAPIAAQGAPTTEPAAQPVETVPELIEARALVMSHEGRIERLERTASRYMAASALYHGSPHDSVATRQYGEARAAMRDLLPADDEEEPKP